MAAPKDPKPPALLTEATSSGVVCPAQGAWIIGRLIRNARVSGVANRELATVIVVE